MVVAGVTADRVLGCRAGRMKAMEIDRHLSVVALTEELPTA